MNRNGKRLLAVLMAGSMLAVLPLSALAADEPSELEALKRATELANARKAEADARAAQSAAEIAEIQKAEALAKARIGIVTGTDKVSGGVTTDTGAGGFESSLLAAVALKDAAQAVQSALPVPVGCDPAKTCPYILYAGDQKPNFSDLRLMEVRLAEGTTAYQRAEDAAKVARLALSKLDGKAPVDPAEANNQIEIQAAPVATAGFLLDAVSKLGSYFQSDYKVSPVATPGIDADLVAVTLAGELSGRAVYPARWSPRVDTSEITAMIHPLAEKREAAKAPATGLAKAKTELTERAAKEKNEAVKAQLTAAAKLCADAVDAYAAADKLFDAIIASLAAPDASGVAGIVRLAEQKYVSDRLTAGSIAVFVKVGGAAGTTYTRKNLWTFFGGLPFYASGGAVVSYLAVDKDGFVKAAGQIPVSSGFCKVSKVKERVKGPNKLC